MNPTDLVFSFVKNELLVVVEGETLRLPTVAEIERHAHQPSLDIGHHDGQTYWGHHWPHTILPSEQYQLHGLRALAGRLAAPVWQLAGRAFQLVEWERTHKFCGACGKATARHESGEFAMVCPACGHTSYPRVSPAMICVVRRGRELLLGHAHRFPDGFYSCLAGFVEPGETAEQCVVREVKEESGIEVANVRYIGSQSWPFPHSLMLGFFADYAGGEIVLQDEEISDARWFSPEDLPKLPPKGLSIARHLIDLALEEIAASEQG